MDKLVIGLNKNKNIRVYAVKTTDLVEEVRSKFDMYPTSTAAFGRVLSATLIMGAMQKNKDDKVVVQIESDGLIKSIIAIAKNDGKVKGYIDNVNVTLSYPDSNKLAVGTAIGNGVLKVSKDLNLKHDFVGTTDLVSGEIGDDLAYYFSVSEQTPSVVSVGVLVDKDNSVISAGGLIIQLLPDATEEDIVYVENLLTDLKPISELIQHQSPEEIILDLFKGGMILEEKPVKYECDCSYDKMKKGLIALGKDEINNLISENETVETVCNFCNTKYHFSVEDLKELIDA